MKRFNCYLRTLCLALFALLTAGSQAQTAVETVPPPVDSVEVSLLTCTPGNKVWSLYGHTAVRYNDKANGQDLVINYGMFNFRQSNFVLRFVFGLTDYEMGIEPYPIFLLNYAKDGRGVVEQHLNLTRDEKLALARAIGENYLPQNRVYRYNYFYDNCTTRGRDLIVSSLDGTVEYAVNADVKTSYREMIHQWNANHRWARFGNDLLLGVKADAATDHTQQQFLPDSLRKAFAHAVVVGPDGTRRALVDSTATVLRPDKGTLFQMFGIWDAISPKILFILLGVALIPVSLFERRRRKTFWLVDAVLLTLNGLAGMVLLAMVFSQHPTVSLNVHILLLNPLSLLWVYPVVKKETQGQYHRYWDVLGVCVCLFFVGTFFQDYAEGIQFLAYTLLMRIGINRTIYGRND